MHQTKNVINFDLASTQHYYIWIISMHGVFHYVNI